MNTSHSPKFEKSNHHYIPQFWIRKFADNNGTVWKRQGGKVSSTSSTDIMAEDWLYTEFDATWQPSDRIEDNLSKIERKAALLLAALVKAPGAVQPSDEQWGQLCCWIALTACRHPITMRRSKDSATSFAYALADATNSQTEATFVNKILANYGVSLPEQLHSDLIAKGDAALLAEAEEIEGMSPQDPRLPMLIALEGVGEVATKITMMDLILLDAPSRSTFILGDEPVALSNLSAGFATPLSPHLALGAWPNKGDSTCIRDRFEVDPVTVKLINADQFERANTIVIGPDRNVLNAL